MLDPIQLLVLATKKFPALKYLWGLAGIVAILALIQAFKIDHRFAVWGGLFLFCGLILMFLFFRLDKVSPGAIKLPVLLLAWTVALGFTALIVLLLSSVFFHRPVDLTNWLTEAPKPKPEHIVTLELFETNLTHKDKNRVVVFSAKNTDYEAAKDEAVKWLVTTLSSRYVRDESVIPVKAKVSDSKVVLAPALPFAKTHLWLFESGDTKKEHELISTVPKDALTMFFAKKETVAKAHVDMPGFDIAFLKLPRDGSWGPEVPLLKSSRPLLIYFEPGPNLEFTKDIIHSANKSGLRALSNEELKECEAEYERSKKPTEFGDPDRILHLEKSRVNAIVDATYSKSNAH